jgi:uncharacterized protein (TIGR03435 family)
LACDRALHIIDVKPPGTTEEQARLMMQSLLAERFHLAVHTEKKEMSAYVLLPGKDTSKLLPKKSEPDVPGCDFGTLGEFANLLAYHLDRPVADQTGIPGRFYFVLTYIMSFAKFPLDPGAGGPAPPPLDPRCPTRSAVKIMPWNIFDAVREQMGLRLEQRGKAQVSVLIVDRVNKALEKN